MVRVCILRNARFPSEPRPEQSNISDTTAAAVQQQLTRHRPVYTQVETPAVLLFNLRHHRDYMSTTSRRGILYTGTMVLCIKMTFFRNTKLFSYDSRPLLALSAAGSQGTRLYTTVQVWIPPGLRGACYGFSKSRNPASNYGIAFRPARVNQAHANPYKCLFYSFSPLSAAVFEVPQQPSKVAQPRYNSHASTFPLCDSHEWCFCVWVREHACVCACHRGILQQ